MNKLALAAFGAASLLAVPCFAQSSTASSANTTSSGNTTSGGNTSGSQMSPAQARQQITQNLQKDGFTDVHVIPDSFLVHAQNKEGQPVVMIINPNSVFSVTQVGSGNSNGGQPQSNKSD